MDDRLEQFENQAREWAMEQLARVAKFLQDAVPVVQEAAEDLVETIREKLPVVQQAFKDTVERLVSELNAPDPPDPPAEEAEARRGIAELEDYLRDR